jgi:TetR/AcrR family transcriptional regulator, tetracycline repressor protein
VFYTRTPFESSAAFVHCVRCSKRDRLAGGQHIRRWRITRQPGRNNRREWSAVASPPWAAAAAAGRQSRAHKPVLSREAIIEAAIRIVDAEGLDAVSMRRVAQEFETGAASLYAYVTSKEELFDLIVDWVMREIVAAAPAGVTTRENWQERLKDTARLTRTVLTSHRDVARAFLGRIPFGPNGLVAVELQLAILRAGGVSDRAAAYAGDLVGEYVVSCAIEDYIWRSRYPGAGPQAVSAHREEISDYLAALPVDRFPNLVALARPMMGLDAAGGSELDRFEMGLDIIVRGLAAFSDNS